MAAQEPEPTRRGRPRRMSLEQLRVRVIDAAIEEFGTAGPAASVDAIAQRADVAKPSVYELFATKDALYDAAAAAELERLVEHLQASQGSVGATEVVPRTRARIGAIFEYAEQRPAGVRLLTTVRASTRAAGEMRSARAGAVARIAGLLRDDLARVGRDLGLSADVLATMLVAMVIDVARRAVDEGWPTAPIVDLMTSFVLGGFAALDGAALRALDEFGTEA